MAEPRWLTESEQRSWLAYRRMVARLNLQVYRDLAADSGLSEPDYDVLSTLSSATGHRYRLNALAEKMLWSRSRLSHHISRMEQRGLVSRFGDEKDGRGTTIVLTKAGLAAIKRAAPGHVASVREHFIDLLTEDEIATLARIGEKVVDHLTER